MKNYEWDLAENTWFKDELMRYIDKYPRMGSSEIAEITMAVFVSSQYAKYNTCFYYDVCEKPEKADCSQCIEQCMNGLAKDIWQIYDSYEEYAEKIVKDLSHTLYKEKLTISKNEAYNVFDAWIIKPFLEAKKEEGENESK